MILRPDQQSVVDAFWTYRNAGKSRIGIVAPTGWGKTVAICSVLSKTDPSQSILWVAHRDFLLVQAFDTLHAYQPNITSQIVFLNAASPRIHRADILVVDEAHHLPAPRYDELVATVAPELLIATTATPKRSDRIGLKLDATVVAPSHDALIADGILAPFDHYSIDAHWSVVVMATTFLADPTRWGPTLLFVSTCAEAEDLVSRLRVGGVHATTALGDSYKDAAIQALRDGRVQALVTVHALGEGLDVPSVRTCFLRDSCTTVVLQCVGRALRPSPGKVANIVQFGDPRTSICSFATPSGRWVGPPAGPWTPISPVPLWPQLADAAKASRYSISDHAGNGSPISPTTSGTRIP